MDQVQRLISGYLDAELSSEEANQLAGALETDAASVDRLVFHSFIHAQMLEWMDHQSAPTRTSSAAFEAEPRQGLHMASGTLHGDKPGHSGSFSYEDVTRFGNTQATRGYRPRLAVAAAI